MNRPVLLAALALAALPATASAQTASQFPDRPITRGEVIAVVKRQFAQMDVNHDGVVTRPEFDRFRARQQPAPASGVDALSHIGATWFDRTDTKGDGRITPDEALARPLHLFDLADVNKDGVVSVQERQVAMTLMGLMGGR
ncbi:MAG: EF-hand domain-containing protein [Janthinobacterium lividum]